MSGESIQSFHVTDVEGSTVISELDERDHVEEYLNEQRERRQRQKQQQQKARITNRRMPPTSTHTMDTEMYDEFNEGGDGGRQVDYHNIPEGNEDDVEDEDELSMSESAPLPASVTSNRQPRRASRKQGLQSHLQANENSNNGYNAVAWNTNASVVGGMSVGMDTTRRSTTMDRSMVSEGGGSYNSNEYGDEDEDDAPPASKEAVHALHCAAVAAKTFDEHFMDIKNPQRENATPLFHAQELMTSREAIRQSGYYTEYALTAVRLLTENGQFGDSVEGMTPSSTSQKQTAARQRFMERSIDGHYSVKYLQAGLIEATDHGGTAAGDMIYETRILMNLTPQHPNIAPIYGVNSGGIDTFLETAGPKEGFFFITDRMTETLAERLDQWKKGKVSKKAGGKAKTPKLQDRIEVAFDISSALLFLHDRNIVYHIRPDKIGFDARRGMVKLCNFSQARYDGMREHQSRSITKAADMATLAYTAPELLCKSPGTPSCDVYGFGIMLWELMSMRTPFEGFDRAKHFELVVQQHKRPPMNKKWNSDIKALLLGCWDPHLRLSMKKVNATVEKVLLVMIEEQEQFRLEKEQNRDVVPEEVPMAQPTRRKQMRRNSTGGRGVYEEVMRQKEMAQQQQQRQQDEADPPAEEPKSPTLVDKQAVEDQRNVEPKPRMYRRASTGMGGLPGVAPQRVTHEKSPSASNRSASPGPGRLRPRRRKSGNTAVTFNSAKENNRQATSLAQLPSQDYEYGYGNEIPNNSTRTSKTNPVMNDHVSVQSYQVPKKKKNFRRASMGHVPANVKRAPLYRKRGEDGSYRQEDDRLYESTGHLTEPTAPMTEPSEPMESESSPQPSSPGGGSRLGLHQYAMQRHEGSSRSERQHGDLDGSIGPPADGPKSPMKSFRRSLASVKEVFSLGGRGVPKEIGVDIGEDDNENENDYGYENDDSMLAYASGPSTLRPPSNARQLRPPSNARQLRPPSNARQLRPPSNMRQDQDPSDVRRPSRRRASIA